VPRVPPSSVSRRFTDLPQAGEVCSAQHKNDGKSFPAVLRMLAPAAYQPTSKPTRRAGDSVLLKAYEPAVCVTKLKSPW
jgi:hypothetical protein